jgi:hypothetical protein
MNLTVSRHEKVRGKRAYQWPERLAAREAVNARFEKKTADDSPHLVDELVDFVRTEVMARGQSLEKESWEALHARFLAAAETLPTS